MRWGNCWWVVPARAAGLVGSVGTPAVPQGHEEDLQDQHRKSMGAHALFVLASDCVVVCIWLQSITTAWHRHFGFTIAKPKRGNVFTCSSAKS